MHIDKFKSITRRDPDLRSRVLRVLKYASTIRSTEIHLTNACNLRCKGCWFFTFEHDQRTAEEKDLRAYRVFARKERERGVNSVLLIGGEPTLYPERIRVMQEEMTHVSISSNGLRKLPYAGFEDVAIGVTLFGGGPLDDELRGINPSGRRISGLFERALENYRGDPRVKFIYAVVDDGAEHVEPTVRRIHENGNGIVFNYYSAYDSADRAVRSNQSRLLEELLRVKGLYPETVACHPYFLQTLITGKSHFGNFGGDVCPSISVDHPENGDRISNGKPYLPLFNTWSADLKSLERCCTSGNCAGCRDSQAMQSWLLVSLDEFLETPELLRIWLALSETYWSHFIWSPYHPQNAARTIELQSA